MSTLRQQIRIVTTALRNGKVNPPSSEVISASEGLRQTVGLDYALPYPQCSRCEGRGILSTRNDNPIKVDIDCPQCMGTGHAPPITFKP